MYRCVEGEADRRRVELVTKRRSFSDPHLNSGASRLPQSASRVGAVAQSKLRGARARYFGTCLMDFVVIAPLFPHS